MIANCSTPHAPWYVIPSNHKWFRDLAISQIIANTMDDMDMQPPQPTVDVAEIRKLYEAEVAKAKAEAAKADGEKGEGGKENGGKGDGGKGDGSKGKKGDSND